MIVIINTYSLDLDVGLEYEYGIALPDVTVSKKVMCTYEFNGKDYQFTSDYVPGKSAYAYLEVVSPPVSNNELKMSSDFIKEKVSEWVNTIQQGVQNDDRLLRENSQENLSQFAKMLRAKGAKVLKKDNANELALATLKTNTIRCQKKREKTTDINDFQAPKDSVFKAGMPTKILSDPGQQCTIGMSVEDAIKIFIHKGVNFNGVRSNLGKILYGYFTLAIRSSDRGNEIGDGVDYKNDVSTLMKSNYVLIRNLLNKGKDFKNDVEVVTQDHENDIQLITNLLLDAKNRGGVNSDKIGKAIKDMELGGALGSFQQDITTFKFPKGGIPKVIIEFRSGCNSDSYNDIFNLIGFRKIKY